jgi:tetratricopeptide (TPR) repeat protein/O-antigen ligase
MRLIESTTALAPETRAAAPKTRFRMRLRSWADMLAILAVGATLAALGYFPDLLPVAHCLLMCALLAGAWPSTNSRRFAVADYVAIALAFSYLIRLLVGGGALAIPRAGGLYTGAAMYGLARNAQHSRIFRSWVVAFAAFGTAVLAVLWIPRSYEWIQAVRAAGFADASALKVQLGSVFGWPLNEWATVTLLGIVFQLVGLCHLRRFSWTQNSPWIAALIATSSALLLTLSRGAYVALLVLAAGLAPAICCCRLPAKLRLRVGVVCVLAIALAAIGSDVVSGGAVRKTAGIRATEQQRRSTAGRFSVWSGAVESASGYRVFGTGLGTFAMHYVPYAGLGEGRSFVGRALNTLLTVWTEEGLVGLFLHVALLLAAVLPALSSAVRIRQGGPASTVLLAGVLALWARELTFSSIAENPLVMALYWLLIALLVGTTAPGPRAAGTIYRACLPALAFVSFAIAAGTVFWMTERQREAEVVAASAVQRISEKDPDQGILLSARADAIGPNIYYRSLSALSRALVAMPWFDPKRPFQIAPSSAGRQYLQEALRDYDQAIAANPSDDLFWHNRAWVRLSLGWDVGRVIPGLQRAVAIDGATAVYRVSLGLAYEQKGSMDQAVDQYAWALAGDPELVHSGFAGDLKSRAADKWERALALAADRLRRRDPRNSDTGVRARLGRIEIERGEYRRAEDILSSVTEAMPQFPRAWVNLARIRIQEGALRKAAECLSKATFLNDRDPLVWDLRSELARKGIGDDAEALEDRAAVLSEQPVSAHAQRVSRVYKTRAVVRDDVLPAGLLVYCSTSFPQ